MKTRKGVRGPKVNCQDCASAVAPFGNLLGVSSRSVHHLDGERSIGKLHLIGSPKPLLDPLLKKYKEFLHVGERRLGVVIVILQPMFVVVTLGQDFVNYKARLL